MIYLYLFLFLLLFLLILFKFNDWFNRKPKLNLNHINCNINNTINCNLNNIIISPAYGTIKKINYNNINKTYEIAIFLNITDIHSQYYPVNGKVISMIYDLNGKYNLAFDLEKSKYNEKYITLIKDMNNNVIKITQIAGLLARRIQTPFKVGQYIKLGDYLGRILLGSRVDIEIPNKYKILIKENEYISPNKIIAQLI
jgi:phosphatidylserine decarboxylase precursor-related protein